MLVADVLFTWKKSPSADVSKVIAVLNVEGIETQTEIADPSMESWQTTIGTEKSGTFRVDTYDGAGNVAVSQVLTWSVPDLEAPLPATNLSYSIVGTHDDGNPAPAPSGAPKKSK